MKIQWNDRINYVTRRRSVATLAPEARSQTLGRALLDEPKNGYRSP